MRQASKPLDASLWIVDDDQDIRTAARLLLKRSFQRVEVFDTPNAMLDALRTRAPCVILLDLNFTQHQRDGQEGLDTLSKIRNHDQDLGVILMTAYGQLELAVQGIKRGATDFVLKPWDNDKLLATLRNAGRLCIAQREARQLRQSNQALKAQLRRDKVQLVGGEGLDQVRYLIEKAAPTDANILILGENGTGKSLVARAIHESSKRSDAPFVSVDLGAITPSLFESELFGHEKGAFTGALRPRKGRFASAQGGTIFLDELGNLDLSLQAKLLTVLEQRSMTPVGSDRPIALDLRVLAATNLEADRLQDPQVFRQDLLFRLNTVQLVLPPLRERKGDILELAWHCLREFRTRYDKPTLTFSKEALSAIESHHWPGNVRALRHAIERATIMANDTRLELADLDLDAAKAPAKVEKQECELNLERLERRAIEAAMNQHQGNISQMAKSLGLTRAALYRRLEKYGL